MGFLDVLQQYVNPGASSKGDVASHFDQVSQQASPSDLGQGLAAAFRSSATPSFGETIGGLFGHSNGQQQVGVVNELLQSSGPGALSGVAGGILGRVLGATGAQSSSLGAAPSLSSSQVSQLSQQDVSQIAAHAEQHDESVIDRVGQFYAQHPTLVKTMGAVASSAVMGHMSQANR